MAENGEIENKNSLLKFLIYRSKALITAAFMGLSYIIYLIVYYFCSGIANTGGIQGLGAAIANRIFCQYISYSDLLYFASQVNFR